MLLRLASVTKVQVCPKRGSVRNGRKATGIGLNHKFVPTW